MEYGVSDLYDRIRSMERRIRQLEVSPRIGIQGVVGDFSEPEFALITNSTNVWSDFAGGDSVVCTTETAERALVFLTARPEIVRSTAKWGKMEIGYQVSNAASGVYITAGDTEGTCRTLVAYTSGGGVIDGVFATYTQIAIEAALVPGENTFTLLGKYLDLLGGSVKPTAMCRGITVLPLDV